MCPKKLKGLILNTNKNLFCFAFSIVVFINIVFVSGFCVAKEGGTSGSDVVATVNDEKLTRTQLADFLIDSFSKEGMEILIRRVLVEQKAKQLKVTVSQKELDYRIKNMVELEVKKLKDRYTPDQKGEFEKDLLKMGYDETELRKKLAERVSIDVRPQMLAEKLIMSTISITEADLKAAYEERYGEKIQVRQIVVKTSGEAEEILSKIHAGADFIKLANERSLDRQSATKGGLMPPLSPNSALGKAVGELKKGDITDVVPSKNGFHLFKMEGKIKQTEMKSYEEALPELKQILVAVHLRKRSGPWFLKLIESADIKNHLEP